MGISHKYTIKLLVLIPIALKYVLLALRKVHHIPNNTKIYFLKSIKQAVSLNCKMLIDFAICYCKLGELYKQVMKKDPIDEKTSLIIIHNAYIWEGTVL